jgi:hypothetical protein
MVNVMRVIANVISFWRCRVESKRGTIENVRTFFVFICSLALVCAVRGDTKKLTRFPGFIWLIGAGFALPKTRDQVR